MDHRTPSAPAIRNTARTAAITVGRDGMFPVLPLRLCRHRSNAVCSSSAEP
jgi:hypothetical protein